MNIEIEIEHGADIASGVDIEGITQYAVSYTHLFEIALCAGSLHEFDA